MYNTLLQKNSFTEKTLPQKYSVCDVQFSHPERKVFIHMQMTSSKANTLLRKLNEDYEALLAEEQDKKSFLAATGEDVESVRPDYQYESFQKQLDAKLKQILALKHAINVFNVTTTLPGTEMTIDQVLIRIPQLSRKKSKLQQMKSAIAKVREDARRFGSTSIMADYRYANYDIAAARRDYEQVSQELADLQEALDLANTTIPFEVDLPADL